MNISYYKIKDWYKKYARYSHYEHAFDGAIGGYRHLFLGMDLHFSLFIFFSFYIYKCYLQTIQLSNYH